MYHIQKREGGWVVSFLIANNCIRISYVDGTPMDVLEVAVGLEAAVDIDVVEFVKVVDDTLRVLWVAVRVLTVDVGVLASKLGVLAAGGAGESVMDSEDMVLGELGEAVGAKEVELEIVLGVEGIALVVAESVTGVDGIALVVADSATGVDGIALASPEVASNVVVIAGGAVALAIGVEGAVLCVVEAAVGVDVVLADTFGILCWLHWAVGEVDEAVVAAVVGLCSLQMWMGAVEVVVGGVVVGGSLSQLWRGAAAVLSGAAAVVCSLQLRTGAAVEVVVVVVAFWWDSAQEQPKGKKFSLALHGRDNKTDHRSDDMNWNMLQQTGTGLPGVWSEVLAWN